MKPADYFYLLLAPVLLSAGQVLFKKTADAAITHSLSRFLGSLLASPHFWAALFIYGAATLLWVFTLSRVPLGRAIPFVALTFVIVPLIGAAFFGERLNILYWLGVFIILVGVSVTVAAQGAAVR